MNRLELLGGMSWESSAEYYRMLQRGGARPAGGHHSADCLLRSVDFTEIEPLQQQGRWDEAGARLAEQACALEAAGAEIMVLCTNTMHKVADQIVEAIDIVCIAGS
jgi:aspartate racemase